MWPTDFRRTEIRYPTQNASQQGEQASTVGSAHAEPEPSSRTPLPLSQRRAPPWLSPQPLKGSSASDGQEQSHYVAFRKAGDRGSLLDSLDQDGVPKPVSPSQYLENAQAGNFNAVWPQRGLTAGALHLPLVPGVESRTVNEDALAQRLGLTPAELPAVLPDWDDKIGLRLYRERPGANPAAPFSAVDEMHIPTAAGAVPFLGGAEGRELYELLLHCQWQRTRNAHAEADKGAPAAGRHQLLPLQQLLAAQQAARAHLPDAENTLMQAMDTWRKELADAQELSGEERHQAMAAARMKWLDTVTGNDAEPWKKWDVLGLSVGTHNAIRMRVDGKQETVHQIPGETKVDRWKRGVTKIEKKRDEQDDAKQKGASQWGRFGICSWQPPITLTGISMERLSPDTWIFSRRVQKQETAQQSGGPAVFPKNGRFYDAGTKEETWLQGVKQLRACGPAGRRGRRAGK